MLWVLLAVPSYGLLGRLPGGGRQKGQDASDWSSRDWDLNAGAYEPPVSFSFGLMSPSLVQTTNESSKAGAAVKSGDGVLMKTQATQSLDRDAEDAAGLAFRGYLPSGLEPCDHSVVHVHPGDSYGAVEPNRLATPCYRFVVNQEVHTLQVVVLPAATAQTPAPAEYDRKHTFAIRVSEVDPARTRTNYDARTGSFDVQLFPSANSAPEMSFTQVEDASLLAHRVVPTPALETGSGMSVTHSSGQKLVA